MKAFYAGDHKKGEIEIQEQVSVFKNKYLEVFNDRVIFPSGYNGTYIRIQYPNDLSVAVLPIMDDGRVVMIKNFRHALRGWGYEVPKGGVEADENPTVAASRELFEETGLVCDRLEDVGEYSDSPAICRSILKCYFAFGCRRANTAEPEKTEAISGIREFDAQSFLDGEDPLDFSDSLSQLLVYKYLFRRQETNQQDRE